MAPLRGAGRDGPVTADELIEFGQRKKCREQLLRASQDCAVPLHRDSLAFDAA